MYPFTVVKNRNELWKALRKIGAERIAEIGVSKGGNLRGMIRCEPELAVAIDTWKSSEYYSFWSDEVFEERYKKVCRMALLNRCILPIRMDSLSAAELFPNDYFDFIYIDAQHDYKSVKQNINAWWPKVKEDGFLSGHDYHQGLWTFVENENRIPVTIEVGVKQAVDEFAEELDRDVFVFTENRAKSWVVKK